MNGLCCCRTKIVSVIPASPEPLPHTYLLIPNRKLPLGLLVHLREGLQLLDGLVVQHRHGILDVALGVLVAGEDLCVVGERGERLVERRVHLLGAALEELAAARVEQRVAREHGPPARVLQEPADAVLRVARRVQALDGDAADGPALAVARRLGHALGALACDDGQVRQPQLLAELLVAACVVPVAGFGVISKRAGVSKLGGGGSLMCVHYGFEVDLAALDGLLQDGSDSRVHM